jgi:beta-carotene 3-hydroxylase
MGISMLILLLTFLGMEAFSWAFHKYVLHGILWNVHKTHHQKHPHPWELNDVVSLAFALVATFLIVKGSPQLDYRFWMGLGISVYGLLYFVLHDILIHRRIKWLESPQASPYLKAITRAHRMHHQHTHRKPSESFGLLWVSRKYFNQG